MRFKLTQGNYHLTLWFMFLFAFAVSAWALTNYENAMNRTDLSSTDKLFTGSQISGTATHTTNLFNEGVIGYAFLTAIAVSGCLWVRETVQLPSHFLQSDSNSIYEGVNC